MHCIYAKILQYSLIYLRAKQSATLETRATMMDGGGGEGGMDGLIDWSLTQTLAVFQLYRGVNKFYILDT